MKATFNWVCMQNDRLVKMIEVYRNLNFTIIETKGKKPQIRNWSSLPKPDIYFEYCNINSITEAGFVIPKDIVVIDVDIRNFPNGVNSLKLLEKAIGFNLEENAKFATKTASGGLHLYYRKNPDVKFPNSTEQFKGVEFKQKGQQVILPFSVLPDGRHYELLKGDLKEITDLPQEFYNVIGARVINEPKITGVGFVNNEADIQRVKELLKIAKPAIQGQGGDQTTYNVCCIGKENGLSPDVFFELLCDWNETCSPPWKLEDLKTKMNNAYNYSQNAAGSHSIEEMFETIEQGFLSDEDAKKQEAEMLDWQNELQLNKNGAYKTTLKNTVLFMKHDEHLKGKIAFNEFSGDKVWMQPPYWHNTTQESYTPNGRIWTDTDAIKTRYILNNYNFDVNTNLIYEAITEISTSNHYHPVKEWIEKHSNWDGVNRLDTFFKDYCNADDNVYSKEVARKMFCGIVARVFEPGCKFDYLPIFVGKQGIGKSTLLKILSIHPSWFCDNIGDITNAKEVIPQTRGKLIVEWQELALFSKIDINHSKSFLSTSVDRVREAYHREAKDYPRQFIVIATTNQDKFLLDETGNRRMLPIELKGFGDDGINTSGIAAVLPQLYAEALYLYRSGEKLYITDAEALRIADEIRYDRFKADELEDTIVDWLDTIPEEGLKMYDGVILNKYKIQVQEIVVYCLHENVTRRKLINRIGQILRRLGYEFTTYRDGDKVRKAFVKK